MAMTKDDLSEMEKYKSALWVHNLLSPSADGLICKLIAEVQQAIASREEVVGLLKWLCINTNIRLTLEWCSSSAEIKRILEIVEGK